MDNILKAIYKLAEHLERIQPKEDAYEIEKEIDDILYERELTTSYYKKHL